MFFNYYHDLISYVTIIFFVSSLVFDMYLLAAT